MPPLHLAGSEFQRAVWDILRAIPYGCTVTYGDIARRLAPQSPTGRMSAQAVGGAVGRNPVSILVPCHRVVGAAGRLTGYAGGLERKRWLLEWEGAHIRTPQRSQRNQRFLHIQRKQRNAFFPGVSFFSWVSLLS